MFRSSETGKVRRMNVELDVDEIVFLDVTMARSLIL